jgi:hypothetical protein
VDDVPDVLGHDVGGEAGEHERHRRLIAGATKQSEHATGADRREEVRQIESQDGPLPGVPAGVVNDRAPAGEPLGRRVDRDGLEDLTQDPALDLFEAELGRLDHAGQAAGARDRGVAVVAQPLGGDAPLQPAHVGEPGEVTFGELEPVRELRHRAHAGDRPVEADPF